MPNKKICFFFNNDTIDILQEKCIFITLIKIKHGKFSLLYKTGIRLFSVHTSRCLLSKPADMKFSFFNTNSCHIPYDIGQSLLKDVLRNEMNTTMYI
jgi:hypothetical protein